MTRRLAGGREQLLRDVEMLLGWLSDVEDVAVTVNELRPGRFQMKPDFCVLRGAKVVAIIDAKWKRLDPDGAYGKCGVNQADVYQLHSYAVAYGCPRVALWYQYHAGVAGRDDRPRHSFLICGKVHTESASLQIDWMSLDAYVPGVSRQAVIVQELAAAVARLALVKGMEEAYKSECSVECGWKSQYARGLLNWIWFPATGCIAFRRPYSSRAKSVFSTHMHPRDSQEN